jgi:ABC-2 type transport system ATP-binding protein
MPRALGAAKPEAAAAPPSINAVDALDLEVRAGEFLGLLGPNGAGKTTTIGMLTTRIRPTGGSAQVAGQDLEARPDLVRQRIGVVPQRPNPDRSLTVFENLVFHARYFGVGAAEAERRATALLERFGLASRRNARVDTLSGGMKQRLMIARALSHEPLVLFLDEPTVGLDPQSRRDTWEILKALHSEGRTILMSTHAMDEADRLCERVAILDRGRLIALDSPARLKAQAPGGTLVELLLDDDAAALVSTAQGIDGVTRAEAQGPLLRVLAGGAATVVPPLLRAAESAGRQVRDIHLAPPSLETLFLSLTGRKLD